MKPAELARRIGGSASGRDCDIARDQLSENESVRRDAGDKGINDDNHVAVQRCERGAQFIDLRVRRLIAFCRSLFVAHRRFALASIHRLALSVGSLRRFERQSRRHRRDLIASAPSSFQCRRACSR